MTGDCGVHIFWGGIMDKDIKDAHLTKRESLIARGIIKEDDAQNIIYQSERPRGFTLNLCGHCTYQCTYCPQSFEELPAEYIKKETFYNGNKITKKNLYFTTFKF